MKQTLKKLINHIPTRLPQGIEEFETWASDIITTYDMPNNDSIKFALSGAIMHLPATAAYMPKSYFGKLMLKGAASQVAYEVMEQCKARQKAAVEAEAAKKLEDTSKEELQQGAAQEN